MDIKLLIISTSLLLASVLGTEPNIVPRGYRLDLYPYPGDGVFKGRVRIDVVYTGIGETSNKIYLNVDPSVNVVDQEVKVTRLADLDSSEEDDNEGNDEETPLTVIHTERNNQTYTVYLSHSLRTDCTYQLDLQFDGTLGTDPSHAFYQDSYSDQTTGEKHWFVLLNLKPYQARYVFPCFDDPQFKTWFELSVAHKGHYHVLSSMPVTDVTNITAEGVWQRDHFTRTPLMSVNSLALLVSDFQQPVVDYLQKEYKSEGVQVGVWGRKDFVTALTKSQQLLPSVMVSLEIYLSRPYPLEHLNFVALPGYNNDSTISAWGLQFFRESDLMNGNTFWLSHRLAKAALAQWFNHLATPDNQTVLSGGLVSFLATTVAKQLEQPAYNWYITNLHNLYLEYGKPKAFYTDQKQRCSLAVTQSQLFYQMIDYVIGTQTFKTGIQNFLTKKEFKMYTEEELLSALTEQAHIDKTLPDDLTISDIACSWLVQRLPLVIATRNYKKNTIIFSQQAFINQLESRWVSSKVVKKPSAPDDGWWIPLVIIQEPQDQKNLELGNDTKPVTWLKRNQHQLTLSNIANSNEYIIINPANIGPFLVNYDNENWYMLSNKMSTLPELIRTQLLHDALTLSLAGHLNTLVALNMTNFLKKEQSPVVWRTFYPLADRLRKQFEGTEAAKGIDAYIQALITPVMEALGEETDKSPIWKADFRVKTRHLLCSSGFSGCVEHARSHYAKWLNSSQPDAGMPFAQSYLCTVFSYGTDEEWEFGLERLIHFSPNRSQAERNFLLKSLAGCPHSSDKYYKLLNITFLGDITNETFSEADKFTTLTAMSSENIGYNTIFKFISDNWDVLKKRLSANLWEYYIQVAMGRYRSQEGLNMVTELLNTKKGKFGGAERSAEEAVETVRAQVKWAEENTPDVVTWLNHTMEHPWTVQRFKYQDINEVARTRKFG